MIRVSFLIMGSILTLACSRETPALASQEEDHLALVAHSSNEARAIVRSICDEFCREYKIHEGTLNSGHNGSFDLSGIVDSKVMRQFDGQMGDRLRAIGWLVSAYQIQFDDPERFLMWVRPGDVISNSKESEQAATGNGP